MTTRIPQEAFLQSAELAQALDEAIGQAAQEADTVAAGRALGSLRDEILEQAAALLANGKKEARSIFLYPLE